MRPIDADAYVTVLLYDDEHEEEYEERMTIAEALDRYTNEGCQPTIEAVSVVRCKECSKHNTHRCHMAFDLIATEDDDFCSYAEREGE